MRSALTAGAGILAVLLLAGCGTDSMTPDYPQSGEGAVSDAAPSPENDAKDPGSLNLAEKHARLSDGRTVTCPKSNDIDGLSCDWEHATPAPTE
jgi:hypothetical protein